MKCICNTVGATQTQMEESPSIDLFTHCHNSPFQVISGHFPNFGKTLFIKHYSSKHYSSVYYSSFSRSIWYSEKLFGNLLFTEHYSFPEKFSPFTCITHFIVNLVYGYSNSRNRIGSGANSCIISNNISYGLEIVCISSVGHLHVIPLLGFSNLYIWYI